MRWLIAIGELALLVWFVAIGLEAMMQRLINADPSPFRLREFHHAYAGCGLVVIGFWIPGPIAIFVQLLGVVLTADDHYQHLRQTLNGEHRYLSPLHRFFADYLWPLPFVPPLTRFLDHWWLVGVVLGLLFVWVRW